MQTHFKIVHFHGPVEGESGVNQSVALFKATEGSRYKKENLVQHGLNIELAANTS